MPQRSIWTSGGALLPAGAALLTASCCLPLGLGLGSATLTFLVPWRPYFLALTVILLGWAFYQATVRCRRHRPATRPPRALVR